MKIINSLARNIGSKLNTMPSTQKKNITDNYQPTPYLAHPFLQSVYNITEPMLPFEFKREKIFF